MVGVSRATQTNSSDRLAAIQMRLTELRALLTKVSDKPVHEVEANPNNLTIRKDLTQDGSTIFIGPNLTKVDRKLFQHIRWDCYSLATRALLDAVFDKETLATRNLSGTKRDSRGSRMSVEYLLDPLKVSDVIQMVQHKCKVEESKIRKVITNKCADTANTKRFKCL